MTIATLKSFALGSGTFLTVVATAGRVSAKHRGVFYVQDPRCCYSDCSEL